MSKIAYRSKAGQALVDMFAEYAKVNPRELPELLKKQGAELAGNLYLLTPRADKTEIQLVTENRGGRFIRAPRAFAQKVGPKAKAYFKANASQVEATARKQRNKAKRINKRRAKLETKAAYLPKLGRVSENATGLRKGLTLTEEKYAATQLRLGRRGALAASFVPAMKQLGSKLKVSKKAANRAAEYPQSKVLLTGNAQSFEVDIVNTAPGVSKVNRSSRFVDKAIYKTVDNMRVYRDRKRKEMADAMKRAAAKTK